ncbi:MAG: ABC transporter permease subunit [Oscillospiraceae bacterium]|jgi:putative aldouronate transport system permease protein|nr:ABC transporter permease subunit [Oscillospiraceae bacterium]
MSTELHKSGNLLRRLLRQKEIQIFVLLGVVFLLIFNYMPLMGVVIAFKDYSITSGIPGIFKAPFNNFAHFKEFFSDRRFMDLLRNTVCLSVLKLICTFPAPIILAILINEVRNKAFKRIVQTVSYLPNFISWVLVLNLATFFFSENKGVFNEIFMGLGLLKQPVNWLTSPGAFYGFSSALAVWKTMGWWAIIYLASITSIDPALYEAAGIDGAGRIQKILHITFPGIKGAIITVLILSIGGLLGGGMGGANFEQSYLFGNVMNNSTSEIIQTHAFKLGLAEGRFAYATAVDLCQSCISILLILVSNKAAKMISGDGIF